MVWNQPDDNEQNRDPQGSSKLGSNSEGSGNKDGRDQGSSDLDDIFHKLDKKLSGLDDGKGTRSDGGNSSQSPCPQFGDHVVTITAAATIIIQAISSFCTIKEAEHGVVTRLDKFSCLVGPGLNWKPTFIDKVKLVNVGVVRELTTSDVMPTSGEDIVRVEMDMQYHATDLEKYPYNVTNPDDNLCQAADSALRGAIGKYAMSRILMEGHTIIRNDTQCELEGIVCPYDMDITLLDVNFRATRPPEEVKVVFDDAVAACESEQQYTHEAEAYTNEVQPRADGQAQCILEEMRTYKAQTILEVQGEVARFAKLLPKYKATPEITHGRLYIEATEKALGNTYEVLINDKGGNLMVLSLDQVPKRGNAPAARDDSGASNLLHLSPASSSTTSGVSDISSTSQGDIMDQHRANAQRDGYQRQGE